MLNKLYNAYCITSYNAVINFSKNISTKSYNYLPEDVSFKSIIYRTISKIAISKLKGLEQKGLEQKDSEQKDSEQKNQGSSPFNKLELIIKSSLDANEEVYHSIFYQLIKNIYHNTASDLYIKPFIGALGIQFIKSSVNSIGTGKNLSITKRHLADSSIDSIVNLVKSSAPEVKFYNIQEDKYYIIKSVIKTSLQLYEMHQKTPVTPTQAVQKLVVNILYYGCSELAKALSSKTSISKQYSTTIVKLTKELIAQPPLFTKLIAEPSLITEVNLNEPNLINYILACFIDADKEGLPKQMAESIYNNFFDNPQKDSSDAIELLAEGVHFTEEDVHFTEIVS